LQPEAKRDSIRAVAARGSGFFMAGSIGMIAGGVLHWVGNAGEPPLDRRMAQLAMSAVQTTMAGLTWSLHGAYQAMSLSYAASAIWAGVLGLVLLALLRPTARALATLSWIFAAAPAALAIIAGAHQIAPPLYVFGAVAALYAVAGVRARV
jgi:hypothetical protein